MDAPVPAVPYVRRLRLVPHPHRCGCARAAAPLIYDGLSETALGRLLGSPLVRLHDVVPSTLDIAHELGAAGAPHGMLVLAGRQTAGRGRQGRAWASPEGGLWMALLVRPTLTPLGGALAVRVGLLARDSVERVAPEAAPRLKWPNDLMVADRKAGGVLCEASWTGAQLGWIAIGIGINVHGPVPPELAGRAVALDDVAPHVTRVAVLELLVPRLLDAAERPPALTDEERRDFMATCWLPEGDRAPLGIDPDGALLIRHADGTTERRIAPP